MLNYINFVDTTEYDYITGSGKLLDRLEKKAEKEGVLSDIQNDLANIDEKLKAKKKARLKEHKKQIKKLIEMEIATRFYFQKGRIQNRLSGDVDVDEALSLLADKEKYDSVLSGSK